MESFKNIDWTFGQNYFLFRIVTSLWTTPKYETLLKKSLFFISKKEFIFSARKTLNHKYFSSLSMLNSIQCIFRIFLFSTFYAKFLLQKIGTKNKCNQRKSYLLQYFD